MNLYRLVPPNGSFISRFDFSNRLHPAARHSRRFSSAEFLSGEEMDSSGIGRKGRHSMSKAGRLVPHRLRMKAL